MAQFFARIFLSDNGVEEREVFCYELIPLDGSGSCTAAEWIKCHLDNYDREKFVERFDLNPTVSNWEIVFEGVMRGWYGNTPESSEDYDEDFDVLREEIQKLPDDWFN